MTRSLPTLTLTGWLESIACVRPDDVAVIDDRGRHTYASLFVAADRVAANLAATGPRQGSRVLIAARPSHSYLAAVLGVLRAGLIACPVNTRLLAAEVTRYAEPLGAALAVVDARHAGLVDGSGVAVVHVDELQHSRPSTPAADDRATAASPAVIFPTGGTTGLPLGAVYTHDGMVRRLFSLAAAFRRHRREVELSFSPFFHVSLLYGPLATLFAGGVVILHSDFDAASALAAMREHGVTRLAGPPTIYTALLRQGGFDTAATTVRDVTYGAAPATPSFVSDLRAALPNARLVTSYGATELGGPATILDHDDILEGRLAGVGRALPGVRLRLESAPGVSAGLGQMGEIAVRAPWQAVGYWGRPEETSATFGSDGYVRVGDLGRVHGDGWLEIVGRSKDVVISGGENVFPAEVEDALTRLPGILEAVVFGVPDPYWGERVEAAVTLRGREGDAEELRASLRAALSGYKVPKRIHVLEALPLTPNNKPDRRALVERYSTDS